MMLMVCPLPHRQTMAASSEIGMVTTTISIVRRSRRKIRCTSPAGTAPRSASVTTLRIALATYRD